VQSCNLTSTLAGLVQCVVVSPDGSGHLETQIVAAVATTMVYVVVDVEGDERGGQV
jgi:hypothetical protein